MHNNTLYDIENNPECKDFLSILFPVYLDRVRWVSRGSVHWGSVLSYIVRQLLLILKEKKNELGRRRYSK